MEGKQITPQSQQEERQHQQRENLLTAIAKLTWLGSQFAKGRDNTQPQAATDYFTFAELVARDGIGIPPETFARHKVEALEQTLKEVRELTTPAYYETHPVYKYALQYIGYLQGARVEAEQQTTEPTSKQRGRKRQTPNFTSFFVDKSQYGKVVQVLKQHQREKEAAPAAKIILAAQELGYITKNINFAALYRALKPILDGLASERAFREAMRTGTPQEYIKELQ